MISQNSIGLFDSGVGGLSVLRHFQTELPQENLIYLADQAHVPYGARSRDEIIQFSKAITQFFLNNQIKLIVIPCNTASAAALSVLRQTFPEVPFVGMEPAVKPAAHQTKSGKVGVLATVGTLESERYGRLMAQYAKGVNVWQDPCIGLVERIEAGEIDTFGTEQFLRQCVEPMLAEGIDTLVLGCTHYPFIRPLLEKIVGGQVHIVDPAPAIVRQTKRVLQQRTLLANTDQVGTTTFITTGSLDRFSSQIEHLLSVNGQVATAVWQEGHLSYE